MTFHDAVMFHVDDSARCHSVPSCRDGKEQMVVQFDSLSMVVLFSPGAQSKITSGSPSLISAASAMRHRFGADDEVPGLPFGPYAVSC